MKPCWPLAIVTAALLSAAPALAQTAETKEKAKTLPPPADARHQLTAGVIIKAEPAGRDGTPEERGRALRLTINTAAVWRDWVRDQAGTESKSPAAAAAQGQKSIATAGEPRPAETLTTVVVEPATPVETRYRSATDEVSEGARTPGNAARAEARTDPADTSATPKDPSAGRAVHYKHGDLKPGLWVEVQYRDAKAKEKATLVRVMRPIGGPQTPAADEKSAQSPRK